MPPAPLLARLLESNNRAASLLGSFFSLAIAAHCLARQWAGGGVRGTVSGLRTKQCYPLHFGFYPVRQRAHIEWGPKSGDKLSHNPNPEAVAKILLIFLSRPAGTCSRYSGVTERRAEAPGVYSCYALEAGDFLTMLRPRSVQSGSSEVGSEYPCLESSSCDQNAKPEFQPLGHVWPLVKSRGWVAMAAPIREAELVCSGRRK